MNRVKDVKKMVKGENVRKDALYFKYRGIKINDE